MPERSRFYHLVSVQRPSPCLRLLTLSYLGGSTALDMRMALSFACNTLIIITTTHAQDFRDVVGDDLLGRMTLPIAWPKLSRILVPIFIVAWSIGISIFSNMDVLSSVLFCVGAIFVAARFYVWRDHEADKRSYFYYNVRTFLVCAVVDSDGTTALAGCSASCPCAAVRQHLVIGATQVRVLSHTVQGSI
jgi:hypothetical protein